MHGAFIIPNFCDENPNYLNITIEGIFKQTDPNWKIIIIDDCSPNIECRKYLLDMQQQYPAKIEVFLLDKNLGPGACRNIGIQAAFQQNIPIVLFNDNDDISHPRRLEIVKQIFSQNSNFGLVYSTFQVIDENNNPVHVNKISEPILEILESHNKKPLNGDNVWIEMGTKTGYVNKTSSTAVRTNLIYNCPFPNERASEDFHTWMRISAHGAYYHYTDLIPTKYRIPSTMKYQMSRTRLGPNNFNKIKVRVDTDGFLKAIEISLSKGTIVPNEVSLLKSKFYRKLAHTMLRDNEYELADQLMVQAEIIDNEAKTYSNIMKGACNA